MIPVDPLMPIPLVVTYISIAMATLVLCSSLFVSMSRTKKTPYATKVLSMILLTYDICFIILSSVCKFFNYNDMYIASDMTRGFHIAAQMVVAAMALERLFVLNWPYVYLRVVTGRFIKTSCLGLIVFSFVQYFGIRTIMCYTRDKAVNCGLAYSVYFILASTLIPSISFISYIKIYRIIRKSVTHPAMKPSFRQYKGTVASFLVFVNESVTQILYLTLSVVYFARNSSVTKETGLVATLADWVNLINCISDALIYVIWFKEARLELLKVIQIVCPRVKDKISQLHNEIYHINSSETCIIKVANMTCFEPGHKTFTFPNSIMSVDFHSDGVNNIAIKHEFSCIDVCQIPKEMFKTGSEA